MKSNVLFIITLTFAVALLVSCGVGSKLAGTWEQNSTLTSNATVTFKNSTFTVTYKADGKDQTASGSYKITDNKAENNATPMTLELEVTESSKTSADSASDFYFVPKGSLSLAGWLTEKNTTLIIDSLSPVAGAPFVFSGTYKK